MDTDLAPGGHRGKAARLSLVSNTTALNPVSHSEPAMPETDERVGLRMAMAIAILPSLALWALVWYALTHLISNWP